LTRVKLQVFLRLAVVAHQVVHGLQQFAVVLRAGNPLPAVLGQQVCEILPVSEAASALIA
jgi:hypothetical protein